VPSLLPGKLKKNSFQIFFILNFFSSILACINNPPPSKIIKNNKKIIIVPSNSNNPAGTFSIGYSSTLVGRAMILVTY